MKAGSPSCWRSCLESAPEQRTGRMAAPPRGRGFVRAQAGCGRHLGAGLCQSTGRMPAPPRGGAFSEHRQDAGRSRPGDRPGRVELGSGLKRNLQALLTASQSRDLRERHSGVRRARSGRIQLLRLLLLDARDRSWGLFHLNKGKPVRTDNTTEPIARARQITAITRWLRLSGAIGSSQRAIK